MSSRSASARFRLKGVPKQAAEWVAETIRGFQTPPPLPSCDELGSGFWVDVEYLAGVGTPLTAGAKLSFGVLERGLAIAGVGQTTVALPYGRVVEVKVSGSGAWTSGGGFEGGGFGVGGAITGMAIGAALNALTTRSGVETIISVVYDEGELHFLSRTVTPDKLDRDLSVVRTALRRQVASTAADPPALDLHARLMELAALKEKGLLDDAEFATLKAKLLAEPPPA